MFGVSAWGGGWGWAVGEDGMQAGPTASIAQANLKLLFVLGWNTLVSFELPQTSNTGIDTGTLTSGYVDTISASYFFILLCSCAIVASETTLVLHNFVPWVLFLFNCINVVKEKESGRLEVAIILKFSVAKFKSKIRRCSNLNLDH